MSDEEFPVRCVHPDGSEHRLRRGPDGLYGCEQPQAVRFREQSLGPLERVGELLGREPVRARMYAFLVLLCGYLVTRGVITGNDVAFWTAAGSLLLGVPLVESARGRVTPSS